MPDPVHVAGGPSQVASAPTASTGTVITANASTNTKASTWTELLSATSYSTAWMLIILSRSSTSGASHLVDIGVGASTAETPIINNLLWHSASSVTPVVRSYLVPIRVASGTRISARSQCTTGSATLCVGLQVFAAPITAARTLGRVETGGAVTGTSTGTLLNDPGAVAHTDGTWTEIIAATGFAYRWLCVGICNTTDLAFAGASSHLLDLAVGAGGSEQEFLSDFYIQGGTTNDNPTPGCVCIPVHLASGVRIAARHRCSSATTGDRLLHLITYGVG